MIILNILSDDYKTITLKYRKCVRADNNTWKTLRYVLGLMPKNVLGLAVDDDEIEQMSDIIDEYVDAHLPEAESSQTYVLFWDFRATKPEPLRLMQPMDNQGEVTC